MLGHWLFFPTRRFFLNEELRSLIFIDVTQKDEKKLKIKIDLKHRKIKFYKT